MLTRLCLPSCPFQVKDEGFLEYINQILMTGEVAGLLPKDELDMIVNDIRPIMKAATPSVPDTWDNLYQFFLNRCAPASAAWHCNHAWR